MPYAVTHFLIPAILIAIFRDYYLSKKEKRSFPLHYVLIAGLSGLLIDFDYLVYYGFRLFGSNFPSHRIFFHNFLFPLSFLVFGFIFIKFENKELGKHKLKLSSIFFIVCFSSIIHLILDGVIIGRVMLLYPFSIQNFGLDLISYLPEIIQSSAIPIIDAFLLSFWMLWVEWRHKISDFI